MPSVDIIIRGVKPASSESARQQYRRYCLGLVFTKNEEDRKRYSAYLEGMGMHYGFGFEEAKEIASQVVADLETVKDLVDWVLNPDLTA